MTIQIWDRIHLHPVRFDIHDSLYIGVGYELDLPWSANHSRSSCGPDGSCSSVREGLVFRSRGHLTTVLTLVAVSSLFVESIIRMLYQNILKKR